MAMKAETIKARMDKLYNSDWVNFNLFVPELLMVSGMNYSETDEGKGEWKESTSSGGGGQDLINIIKDMADGTGAPPAESDIRNTIGDNLISQLQSIDGIEFRELPLERSNAYTLSAGKQETSTQTIKLKFLLDKEMEILKFLDVWRDMIYADELKIKGSIPTFKSILKSKTKDTRGNGEGYIVLDYITLSRKGEGEVKNLGVLKIAGLIPKKIDFGGKVGPGLDAQSALPIVTVDCIYSMGYLQLGNTKIWMK